MGRRRSTDDALDTIFRTARTYNGYTDEPVTEADIRRDLRLVKMGPTSANQQPARFVWCLSQEAKDKLAAFASATNAAKIRKAPADGDHRVWTRISTSISPNSSRTSTRGLVRRAASRASATRSSTRRCRAPISSSRRARWASTPGRCPGSTTPRSTRRSSPTSPICKSIFISTLGHGDPATHLRPPAAPEFAKFNTVV